MDCGNKLVKFLLLIFNLIFWIFALVIFVLGIVYKLKLSSVTDYLGSDFPVVPDLFIAVGTIALVISFFGCYGAWKENRCMLLTFVSLLVILLIMQLAIVIIAFIAIDDSNVMDEIKKSFNNKLGKDEFNEIQISYECCGVTSSMDYSCTTGVVVPTLNKNITTLKIADCIPDSCYKDKIRSEENLFKDGCYTKLKEMLEYVGVTFGAIALTVVIMQILGIIFAVLLSGAIKRDGF